MPHLVTMFLYNLQLFGKLSLLFYGAGFSLLIVMYHQL